eukprot:Phypoly_transcript_13485.p1 GENE.Phypoly_transcript_13485~~Phypoly_transcript_13485.p1  ORF type:complete len:265 (+),score=62.82 Phypoly_transcript_13485:211-1005(+)
MGERKVLNKYYGPDFDPAKIPKPKRPKNNHVKVRMMLPMSIRCTTCGEFLYMGTKFNSHKETLREHYLGIQIFRLYFKCTNCSAELAIKTDPKNSGYECEYGASRNFEPWREKREFAEEQRGQRAREEMGDAMKALENRTKDNRMEQEIMDALDEIRELNAQNNKKDPVDILNKKREKEKHQIPEEDEVLVQQLFGDGVKRIEEDDWEEDFGSEEAMRSLLTFKVQGMELYPTPSKKAKTETAKLAPKVKVVPKIIPKIAPKPK